jgi:extradiol dioxygenase family protein
MQSIFHFAFNVTDLDETRRFYGGVLGCAEGRSSPTWVDFDFFGHQISCHLGTPFKTEPTGIVDGKKVPMPHFGLVLRLDEWKGMAQRLEAAGTQFVLPPQVRYEGQPGEQWTMFFLDPFGNPLEIKGLASMDGLYKA